MDFSDFVKAELKILFLSSWNFLGNNPFNQAKHFQKISGLKGLSSRGSTLYLYAFMKGFPMPFL